MQKTTRQELNRRFKEVYLHLVQSGEIIKSDRQKSKSAFAERLGTKGHIVDLYLNDKRTITYEQVKQLCAAYQVNEAFMFQGIGKPFERKKLPAPEEKLAMALGINFSPNILFTSIEAFASNTVGVDLLEENERFHIPGVRGDLVAFNINGDSMAPTILSGDMVICSPLEHKEEMMDDEIYAVVTNQSVWVKRVVRCFDRLQRWTHLKLISDNREEFDPFIIEIGEVKKLLKVKRRLTGMG
ncbi:MAG: LexA family transcriptional regulator [Bacteroidota bacterium]